MRINMSILQLQAIKMDFAGDVLFEDVSFSIFAGEKTALIGSNGTGKTTLFRIITGELTPTEGLVSRARRAKIGYMDQHAAMREDNTLYEELQSVFAPLMLLEKELEQIAGELENSTNMQLIERQAALQTQFEERGGLTFRSRTRATLLGLGFTEAEFSQRCGTLSGGQRSKLSLGKLLLSDVQLLLLDEPTNHLDLASVQWLEGFLQTFAGAYIVISHDRYFLDRCTQKTLHLAHGRVREYPGGYSRFLQLKAEYDAHLEKQYTHDMREIKRIEGIIEQQRRWGQAHNFVTARSKEKMLARKQAELQKPESAEKTLSFAFRPGDASAVEVCTITGVAKGFGTPLFAEACLQLRRLDRAFLLGPNGCGKTTLLRILTQELAPDAGSVRFGPKTKLGYFDQKLGNLNPQKTVLDEIWDDHKDYTATQVRSALGLFLFSGDMVYQTVQTLSGGEKAKLSLLKLMLSGANLLLLDEPTNHLDIPSREALETALLQFDGTMLVVSHDRYFVQKIATRTLSLEPAGIREFTGGYEAYEAYTREQAAKPQPTQEKPAKQNTYLQQKERASTVRKAKSEIKRIEVQVAYLEHETAQTQALLDDPQTASDYEQVLALSQEIETATKQQEDLLAQWEALHETIASLEGASEP